MSRTTVPYVDRIHHMESKSPGFLHLYSQVLPPRKQFSASGRKEWKWRREWIHPVLKWSCYNKGRSTLTPGISGIGIVCSPEFSVCLFVFLFVLHIHELITRLQPLDATAELKHAAFRMEHNTIGCDNIWGKMRWTGTRINISKWPAVLHRSDGPLLSSYSLSALIFTTKS